MRYEKVLTNSVEKSQAIGGLLELLKNMISLDEEREYKVRLVANELLTNIFLHAHPKEVHMTAQLDNNMLVITLRNNGQGFSYNDVMQRDVLDKEMVMRENGRGIYLVKQLAEQLEYSSNGTAVRVKINLL